VPLRGSPYRAFGINWSVANAANPNAVTTRTARVTERHFADPERTGGVACI